ncbi:hypothetical protein [Aquimarina sp. 2201CG14-23]|uniref:hypothetical protein n=1 Tax=Aquimarina mycalae TaxID=3040073 RepID=UPI002477E836|nr:hypothetical protein [Aquimarina sp. 2201CG14-23]MDH7445485.1 hypothetical protein [Aquimarina sp. 2201CG14-23]
MKKSILLLVVVILACFSGNAQKIHTIPTKQINQLSSGWHKFVSEGATFDVEVLNGTLIKGNIIWFDTSTYSGSFSGNKISGRGTYTWPNGDRYEGGFRGNKLHGKGTFYKSDGTKHQGKWKHNKKNGKGKRYDSQGNIVQQGTWEQDVYINKAAKK